MDLEKIVEKVLGLIKEVGRKGVNIVVFFEVFIFVYLRGFLFGFVVGSRIMEGREDWKRYYDNFVLVFSVIIDLLGKVV